MDDHDVKPDGPMTAEQLAVVAALSSTEIAKIDEVLMSHAMVRRRKVAMMVAQTMSDLGDLHRNLPDIFYAGRVKALVAAGRLEAFGNLDYMRYSEVCLPAGKV